MRVERKAGLFFALLPGVALELMAPYLGRLILFVGVVHGQRQLLGLV